MSADVLRRAARRIREDWPEDEHGDTPCEDYHPRAAFHRAVADWLSACALILDVSPNRQRVLALNVARAYLGEQP